MPRTLFLSPQLAQTRADSTLKPGRVTEHNTHKPLGAKRNRRYLSKATWNDDSSYEWTLCDPTSLQPICGFWSRITGTFSLTLKIHGAMPLSLWTPLPAPVVPWLPLSPHRVPRIPRRGCHGCSVACAAPPRLRRSAPRGRWRSDAARRAVKPCCRRCSGTALSPWNSVGRRRRSWARRKWMGNWGKSGAGGNRPLQFIDVSPCFSHIH